MNRPSVLSLTLAAASFVHNANASDIFVCPAGCQHTTIQGAVDSSNAADVIHIAAGTYFENLLIPNKRLTLLGAGQDVTEINGSDRGTVITLGSFGDPSPAQTVSIIGVTITHGNATNGGGIFARDTSLDLQNSIVSSNAATTDGGAIEIVAPAITSRITRSMVVHNRAGVLGGGVDVSAESVVQIVDSSIARNTAGLRGGGVHSEGASNTTIQGTTISDNTSQQDGGGIYLEEGLPRATMTISGSSLIGNKAAQDGGGLRTAGGHLAISSTVVARNTAGRNGGGMVEGATLNDVFVIQNTAGGQGGGLFTAVAPAAGNTVADNTPTNVVIDP